MKYCIAILSLFFSLNASAEYNFSHIEGSFIDSESKVDSRTFDGDGFGLSLSYEVGAQFVLFGGLSNFEMEATEDDVPQTPSMPSQYRDPGGMAKRIVDGRPARERHNAI